MDIEEKRSRRRFKAFMKKDTSEQQGGEYHKWKIQRVNDYKNQLPMIGEGEKKKMRGKKLMDVIHQRGGSWSDFTNWVKRTANKIADGTKKAANFVYNKGIKPAWDYAKEKPLTAISKGLDFASKLPTPLSGALSKASDVVGTVGNAVGKGQSGSGSSDYSGPVKSADGSTIVMVL